MAILARRSQALFRLSGTNQARTAVFTVQFTPSSGAGFHFAGVLESAPWSNSMILGTESRPLCRYRPSHTRAAARPSGESGL